ncbi:MAG TPA: FAD-dependent oxidoreductase, partial [Gemmatimonadales bacterium]|nr:FAD-dependent oxidoreductase [Gemmatimonadales bacterium]
MLADARRIPNGAELRADLCIIGAGPAGITVARELASSGLEICMLESGGLEPDPATQALTEGTSIGLPYYRLEATRLRYFGGTSNHWEGVCAPLEPIDFERRAWIANSGWPFGAEELAPFYVRAQELCELGPFAYTADHWDPGAQRRLPFDTDVFRSRILQISPTRFGQAYRPDLESASGMRVYLHANAVELECEGAEIARVKVACLAGNRFAVRARCYVVAAGAIANARLLLASNRARRAGIGNEHDLVGRYFMEHLAVACAVFLRAGHELDLAFYTDAKVGGVTRLGTLNPSESVQRREQLANMRLVFDRAPTHELVRASSPGLAAADRVIGDLREGRMPEDLGEDALEILLDLDEVALYGYRTRFNPAPRRRGRFLIACVEQEPNPASRVTLSDRRDALGLPTVVLDWRLGEIERSTLRRTLRILAAECGRTGIGR